MGVLKVAHPPASLYNSIEFIHHQEGTAKAHADDLTALRELLVKHDMPESVCVKLLHIHFHLKQGEVIVAHELDASPLGMIPFLEPMDSKTVGKVYPCSFVVDKQGDLQAFEYTDAADGPDLTAYPEFVADFCALVVERGVQGQFGIAVISGVAKDGAWLELDYPEKRATFLLPEHVPVPKSDLLEVRMTVTKFQRPDINKLDVITHGHVEHSWSRRRAVGHEIQPDGVTTKGGLHLTGVPLELGTPFHHVVSAIAAAA
jgi:hypothetical protein